MTVNRNDSRVIIVADDYEEVETPDQEDPPSPGPPALTGAPRPPNPSAINPVNTHIQFATPASLCDDLPCPILHMSVRNIYLFQPPSATNKAIDHIPVVLLADAMRRFPEPLPQFDRCNMHAQIPSLGVVIIGSQKGQVVILALTRVLNHDEIHMRHKHHGIRSAKEVFAFRLEHILPLATQEQAGHRPLSPLHGVAVGPVQGTEHLGADQQRWRVMIMFQEHTVLSYEIGRNRDWGVDVREVLI